MMERKLIVAAVSGALALPLTAQAVDFAVSGHVNRVIMSVDSDDVDSDLQHRDANSSQSRFRIKGSGELNNGLTAGVYMEHGASGSTFNRRHTNVYLSGDGGTLTIGHGNPGADAMAFARLGGPSWLGGVTNWCPYYSAGPACESNDPGRTDVLRYDTPALGPVSISTSIGNDEYWDGMIKIAGSVGESGYDLRLGYVTDYDANANAGEQLGASAAFKFGQGTSIAFSWTNDDNGNVVRTNVSDGHTHDRNGNEIPRSRIVENTPPDDETYHVEIDHSYGDGSVGVIYRHGEVGNDDASFWGVGFGHNLGAGATAYAGYRNMSDSDSSDDANLYFVGMRVTFN